MEDLHEPNETKYYTEYSHHQTIDSAKSAQEFLDAINLKAFSNHELVDNTQLKDYLVILHAKAGRQIPYNLYGTCSFARDNSPKSEGFWFIGMKFDTVQQLEGFCDYVQDETEFNLRELHNYRKMYENSVAHGPHYIPKHVLEAKKRKTA